MGFMYGIQYKFARTSAENLFLTSWLRQQSGLCGPFGRPCACHGATAALRVSALTSALSLVEEGGGSDEAGVWLA